MKVGIYGTRKMYPAVLVDHETYYPLWIYPVFLEIKDLLDTIYIFERRKTRSASAAIHELKMPFIVIVNENEKVSNSGLHAVFTNAYSSFLYKLKEEIKFPKGGRPVKIDIRGDYDYIAWKVSEGIDTLWLLEEVGVATILTRVHFDFEVEELKKSLQTLQGKLMYTKLDELEVIYEKVEPLRRTKCLKFYNHTIESVNIEYFFLPANAIDLTGVLFITRIHDKAKVKSLGYGEVELPEGDYIFYHPKPSKNTI